MRIHMALNEYFERSIFVDRFNGVLLSSKFQSSTHLLAYSARHISGDVAFLVPQANRVETS